ncbi:hypothetical protein Agub_g15824 [Astrephomene gubernaculifera]|uniref:Uncharacterized protein n=1 Tax=Astrephomene gubernaculifera TaxID=47775 RepID=A0AAD3E5Z8_9CHLO|nr:hypothetical protein Agub_g15824 [Astrephomene gubernaculifera]
MSLRSFRALPSIGASLRRPKRYVRFAQLLVSAATSAPDTGSESPSTSGVQNASNVRILRYPDGYERRIIYPVAPAVEAGSDNEDAWSLWTHADEDESSVWHDCGLAGAACVVETRVVKPDALQDTDPLVEEITSLHRSSQLQSPQSVSELVKSSYQILTGSPWLLPRPLYVLALRQPPPPSPPPPPPSQQPWGGALWTHHHHQEPQQQQHLPPPDPQEVATGDAAQLYWLPTRTVMQEEQQELAAVLKRPSLSLSLSLSALRDGVVAFGAAEDAARFATCLEAEQQAAGQQVDVMEVDSHQLFRLTGQVGALVVYLAPPQQQQGEQQGERGVQQEQQQHWFLPLPQQLAEALRGEQ